MPDWASEVRGRLSSLRLSPVREAEIVEELSQHLEDRRQELIAGGTSPDAATQLALAEFQEGNLLAWHLSRLRQSGWRDPVPAGTRSGFSWQGLTFDLRQAVRTLRAAPGFTSVALVVLMLGVGASTAIFSVADAVVLRGLPFDQPDRIVAVGERAAPGAGKPLPAGMATMLGPGDPQALSRVQPQNYLDWAAQQQVFSSIAAIADLGEFTLRLPGSQPEALAVQRVTAGFFDVLRILPALGRAFTAENEVEGRHRVAVLSDAFWRQHFGGNAEIVGRTIPLDDGSYEVVGIMPPGVTYPVGALRPTDLWVPYVVPPNERIRGRGFAIYLQSIARLKPGVSIAQAQAQMDQIAAAIERANPVISHGIKFGVRPLRDHLVGASMKSWLLMLLAAVAIVLLIACTNVANLLLARAGVRGREVALRAALGAGRWRLIRQFVVESLVLAAAGTVLAVILASWAIQLLRSAMPEGVPRAATINLDWRVLTVAAGLALVIGLLFGLVPALQCSKPDLANSLKVGGHGARRRPQRLRSVLVVAEVAFAVVLLVGAALFIGSFITVMRVDPGFIPDRVLTMQLFSRLEPGQHQDWTAAFDQIVSRLSQTRGVIQASAVSPGIPLRIHQWTDGMQVSGSPAPRLTPVSLKLVTPDYHRALRIPVRRGRLFDQGDRLTSDKVVIINEAAARTFFPGENPVGRRVKLDRADRMVVGVVGDTPQSSIETAPIPEVYLPMAQGQVRSGYLVIRTSGDPYEWLSAIKAAVLEVLPDVPVRYVATMDELLARQTAQRRLNMLMLALFGLIGLVISAAGVYGVMAYVVSQRTREIGIRIALGATRWEVMGMVLKNAGTLIAAGMVIGSLGAWYLGVTAKVFLYGLEPHDPRVFAAAIVTLSVASLAASFVPAKRAASVDPTVALRAE